MNEWLEARADALGVERLTPEQISLLLNLAGDAAHGSGVRSNAPLLCYLVGRASASGASLEELAETVRSTS